MRAIHLLRNTLPLIPLFLIPSTQAADPILGPGSIAFIGFNADGSDNLAFVTIDEIPANTPIYFTEEEWSNLNGGEWPAFANEAVWTWSNPSATPAGTVILMNDIGTMDSLIPSHNTNLGQITWLSGSASVHSSSDGIYAFFVDGSPSGNYPDPSTFLAFISNSDTAGDIPESLSVAAGTAITYSGGIDGMRFIGSRIGQTSFQDYLPQIANPTNWEDVGTSGDGTTLFAAFDTTAFTVGVAQETLTLTPAPTFSLSISENDGNTATMVRITRSGDTTDPLELTLTSSDTTEASVPPTATIPAESDFIDVPINAVDDSLFDGSQSIFISATASGFSDGSANLTVADDFLDNPQLIINEIHHSPTTDTNRSNGSPTVNSDDEFVELVNISGGPLDISDWTLSDSSSIRHTFASGTVLNAGSAILVFGNLPASPVNFNGTLAVRASSGGLDLGSADSLTLIDHSASLITTFSYSGTNGISTQLETEASPSSYIVHSSTTGSGGDLLSPGTKVDGSSFFFPPYLTITSDRTVLNESNPLASPTKFTTATGTVSIASPLGSDLIVALLSSDTSEATVPPAVTVLRGQTSATFPIQAVDDAALEAFQTATILATATNQLPASISVAVIDDPDVPPPHNLSAGDIAFIGLNTDGGDDLLFVALNHIDEGQIIRLTDKSWSGSTFANSETLTKWTAPLGGLPAGQVVHLANLDTPSAVASIGDLDHGLSLESGAETVYAFQSLQVDGSPTFLAAITTEGPQTFNGIQLNVGTHAVSLPAGSHGGTYTGPRENQPDFHEFLPFIGDPASHWSTDLLDGTTQLPFDPSAFSIAASYHSWALENGIYGALPDDDSNSNGISNLLEYALDLDSGSHPGNLSGNTLSFSKSPLAVANADVTWVIETSPDLTDLSWTPVDPTIEGNTLSYDLPTGLGKVFARLRVEPINP